MLRKLYDRVFALARSRHATPALAVVSFAESSFFPIPPDVMLCPMILARPERAYFYAGVCTAASVLGGILGYAIGYFLNDVGLWVLSLMGHADGLEHFKSWFADWGLWVILIKGLTPIPFKLVTIASGLAGYDLFWFVVLCIITRGARFFLIAALINRFGEPIRGFIEQRLGLVMGLFAVALVGGFALVKFVV